MDKITSIEEYKKRKERLKQIEEAEEKQMAFRTCDLDIWFEFFHFVQLSVKRKRKIDNSVLFDQQKAHEWEKTLRDLVENESYQRILIEEEAELEPLYIVIRVEEIDYAFFIKWLRFWLAKINQRRVSSEYLHFCYLYLSSILEPSKLEGELESEFIKKTYDKALSIKDD